MKKEQLLTLAFVLGALMMVAGAAMYVTGGGWCPYVYTAGSLFVAVSHILTPLKVKSPTLNRLRRQQVFAAVAFVLTGVFMFTTRGNEWIVCLTVGTLLELYTSIRIPQEVAKQQS